MWPERTGGMPGRVYDVDWVQELYGHLRRNKKLRYEYGLKQLLSFPVSN